MKIALPKRRSPWKKGKKKQPVAVVAEKKVEAAAPTVGSIVLSDAEATSATFNESHSTPIKTGRVVEQGSPTSQFEYDTIMEATNHANEATFVEEKAKGVVAAVEEVSVVEEKAEAEAVAVEEVSVVEEKAEAEVASVEEVSVVEEKAEAEAEVASVEEVSVVEEVDDDNKSISSKKSIQSRRSVQEEKKDDESVVTGGLSTTGKKAEDNDEEEDIVEEVDAPKKSWDFMSYLQCGLPNMWNEVISEEKSKQGGGGDETVSSPRPDEPEEVIVTDEPKVVVTDEPKVVVTDEPKAVVTDEPKVVFTDEPKVVFTDEPKEEAQLEKAKKIGRFRSFPTLKKEKALPTLKKVPPKEAAQLHNASYSPGAGIMKAVGSFPTLAKDQVLIRVDATSFSTRDCLERLRRFSNKELKNSVWVPGHEIVGRVVRAGTNSQSWLDTRIAALLPYGGGCSQYVCIDTKIAIALPEETETLIDSNKVVALLSTYMTAYQCLESVIKPKEEKIAEELVKEKDWSPNYAIPLIANYAGQKKSALFAEKKPLRGKNVLIVGAGNPVGLAFVDLAKTAGATVCTLSHRAHLSPIRGIGAHFWYELSQKAAWEAEFGGKMDLIIDTVGDANNDPSFYKVMRTGGRLVRVHTTSCGQKYLPPQPQEEGWLFTPSYQRINDNAINYDIFRSCDDDKKLFAEDLAYLQDLLQIGKINLKIFSQVGLNEVKGEFEKVMAAKTNGGVVVVRPNTMM